MKSGRKRNTYTWWEYDLLARKRAKNQKVMGETVTNDVEQVCMYEKNTTLRTMS